MKFWLSWETKDKLTFVQIIVSFCTLVAAVFIGGYQININSQLKDLNLQPVLAVSYSNTSSTIDFTNFGNLPVFIDAIQIVNIEKEQINDECNIIGVDRTVPPKQMVSFDFPSSYQFSAKETKSENFSIIPVEYRIFFQVVGNSEIYIGNTFFFIQNNNNVLKVDKYHPEIYVKRSRYIDFKRVYEEICPQNK